MLRSIALILAFGVAISGLAPAGHADSWHVVRTVMLMRHGVRPPNQEPPVPASIAPEPWPAWTTRPGWLTEHGAAAIRLVATADARRFATDGLLPPNGCPAPGTVQVISDSLERTIATGDAYTSALAPGCGLGNRHQPQGVPDPLFAEYRNSAITASAATQAVDTAIGPGGATALAQQHQQALDDITRIVCGDRSTDCGLTAMPSGTEIDPSGTRRPKLTGALAHGSVISEVLELEYAEGKPLPDVGWGRATADDIRAVGSLHSLELSIIARPRPLALANAGKIAEAIRDGLADGPPVTVLVGHDTDVANIAGLLDVHWSVPGYADDEPAPGGALVFDLVEDELGNRFVRSSYRAQTLDQIRELRDAPATLVPLYPAGCATDVCPLDTFDASLGR
ncbi:histidine-type phosphatase [Mycolicibacterium sp. CH28]|uniref:histidine-type phosphatase n=1 Tax=Mycolicibacterium sp. CH28 TaxID=2512237 RepID=UPI00108043F0|nr:histidine-type phosphatase [Mycolicibacterium sp. CH28]TGD89666.1 histidine-type phosphatase [Mycolicibacterium sp. CH28]